MAQPTLPPDFSHRAFDEIIQLAAARQDLPVADWTPAHCGDSGMRIAADGRWYHDGGLITRPEMVRLFAALLRREPDGGYVLVTPVEKLSIEVEDAPFLAVDMVTEGAADQRQLAFRLNTDKIVIAGPGNPVRVTETAAGPKPYLQVRDGLDALIARSVFYTLADIALAEARAPLGVWSGGAFFALEPSQGD